MTAETPIITDWCQQFPSHSIGDLVFGPEGNLYVSGGEGANFDTVDWGQFGTPDSTPVATRPAAWAERWTPPDGRRRVPASPGRPHSRGPDRPRRVDPQDRPRNRRSGSPATRSTKTPKPMKTPVGSSATASATPSGSRSGPGPNEVWAATWAGTPGRRSTGYRTRPTRPPTTSAGPATRATPPRANRSSPGTPPISTSARASTQKASRRCVAPYYAFKHYEPLTSNEDCHVDEGSSITGLAFYESEHLPGQVPRGALLHRLCRAAASG